MTKKFLEQKGIPFIEINTETDENKSFQEYIQEFKEQEFHSFPIVKTPTESWCDYRLDKLRNLLTK